MADEKFPPTPEGDEVGHDPLLDGPTVTPTPEPEVDATPLDEPAYSGGVEVDPELQHDPYTDPSPVPADPTGATPPPGTTQQAYYQTPGSTPADVAYGGASAGQPGGYTEPPKKRSTAKIVLIVIGVILLLCCCLPIIGVGIWAQSDAGQEAIQNAAMEGGSAYMEDIVREMGEQGVASGEITQEELDEMLEDMRNGMTPPGETDGITDDPIPPMTGDQYGIAMDSFTTVENEVDRIIGEHSTFEIEISPDMDSDDPAVKAEAARLLKESIADAQQQLDAIEIAPTGRQDIDILMQDALDDFKVGLDHKAQAADAHVAGNSDEMIRLYDLHNASLSTGYEKLSAAFDAIQQLPAG